MHVADEHDARDCEREQGGAGPSELVSVSADHADQRDARRYQQRHCDEMGSVRRYRVHDESWCGPRLLVGNCHRVLRLVCVGRSRSGVRIGRCLRRRTSIPRCYLTINRICLCRRRSRRRGWWGIPGRRGSGCRGPGRGGARDPIIEAFGCSPTGTVGRGRPISGPVPPGRASVVDVCRRRCCRRDRANALPVGGLPTIGVALEPVGVTATGRVRDNVDILQSGYTLMRGCPCAGLSGV